MTGARMTSARMTGARMVSMREGPRSIRSRLLVLLLVPLTAVAVLVAVETYFSARRTANQLYDRTLLAVLLAVRENVVASDGELLTEEMLEVLTENLGDQFLYHVAWPGNGHMTGYANRPEPPNNVRPEGGSPLFFDATYSGDPVRAVSLRQFVAEGTPTVPVARADGWLRVTVWQRVRQRDALAFDLFTRSLLRLLAILGAAGVIVFLAVTRGLRPLEALRAAIEARSPTELSPIRRSVAPELRGIVGAMNDLLGRVERSRVNRERFIADAAHQLRNPLAAIKTQAQAGMASRGPTPRATADHPRRSLSAIVETTDRTAAMVEQMLTGARANALRLDRDSRNARIDPVELARSVALELAGKSMCAGHALSFDAEDEGNGAWSLGDARLVREAVANLIDNAIVHNPVGTSIEVNVRCRGDQIAIEVYDDGRTVPPTELARLSQPFATGNTDAEGSGLGLSIAKDIARSHGGDLTLEEHPERGKTFRITLPRV